MSSLGHCKESHIVHLLMAILYDPSGFSGHEGHSKPSPPTHLAFDLAPCAFRGRGRLKTWGGFSHWVKNGRFSLMGFPSPPLHPRARWFSRRRCCQRLGRWIRPPSCWSRRRFFCWVGIPGLPRNGAMRGKMRKAKAKPGMGVPIFPPCITF